MCYEIGYWYKYINLLYEYFDVIFLFRLLLLKKGGGGIGVVNIIDNYIMVVWFIKVLMNVFCFGR